jgi:hypothetical protein
MVKLHIFSLPVILNFIFTYRHNSPLEHASQVEHKWETMVELLNSDVTADLRRPL